MRNSCRRCGAPFSLEHLQICPTKRRSVTTAKGSVTLEKYAALLNPHGTARNNKWSSTPPPPQARRIRNIREQTSSSSQTGEHDIATKQMQESLDPESKYYIQKILDSWNQVNQIKTTELHRKSPSGLDASLNNKI